MGKDIYWVDRLKYLFHEMIPYKVSRVIGIESDKEGDKVNVISAFRKYLTESRSIPDLASGRMVRKGNKVYYYIECHQPYFGIFKRFPMPAYHSELIDSFISHLEKRFSD